MRVKHVGKKRHNNQQSPTPPPVPVVSMADVPAIPDAVMKPPRMNKSGEKWQMAGNTRLQKVWVWNDTVKAFIKDRIKGYSLNVCAGANPLCDVNIDLDPTDRSIIKGDMRCLMYPPGTFDTVISDPPWKIGYYERFRPFFECVRVCKVGGIIIYNATWIPMTPSGDAELKEVWVRQDSNYTNVSTISIFEKVAENPAYEAAIEKEQDAAVWQTQHGDDVHTETQV